MLVSCAYCNGLHNRKDVCKKKVKKSYKKESTYISKFRNTKAWQRKRNEVKKRDKMLCQYCLLNHKYTFQNLEVHHIEAISINWNKRLDEYNLITLCSNCHKMAESKEIKASLLKEIAEKNVHTF
jgi:5-methylcytosine-specific restriction enzyme A